MDIITPAQCRAARGLLDWSQPELAKRCDVHVQTISNFELDKGSPTKNTLTAIRQVFENSGVEIIEHNGVRETPKGLRVFKGQFGFQEFYNDIYKTIFTNRHTEITLFNGVSDLVLDALGREFLDKHIARMVSVKRKFRFRVIVEEGDQSYLGSSYCEYKCCPSDRFKNKTIYTYDTKVALVDFDDVITVTLFDQIDFAETQLQSFDLAWNHIATVPLKG